MASRRRTSNPTGTLPDKGARQWDHVYESALERGLDKSGAARQAWCAVKRYYYKRGDQWVARKRPLKPGQLAPGCAQYRGSNPPASEGCVLAKHAWDRPLSDCGDDPDAPREAARKLANKRWLLPEELAKVKAKLLRLE